MSSVNKFSEKYKIYYHSLPKFFRVVFLPFTIATIVIFLKYGKPAEEVYFIVGLLFFTGWQLYNQYLDTVLTDDIEGIKKKAKEHISIWKDIYTKFSYLNSTLNGLVESKSELFIKTIEKSEESREGAIEFIRNENSYKNSLDQIIATIHKFFEKFSNIPQDQFFRVCFMVPNVNGKGQFLEIKTWYLDHGPKLRSKDTQKQPFTKGGNTLVGYMLGKGASMPFKIINNLPEYVKMKEKDRLFHYLYPGQERHLKSILCYSVYEPLTCSLLGIICVDSNVIDSFSQPEKYYLNFFQAFDKRIVFEARFNAMKEKLRIRELRP